MRRSPAAAAPATHPSNKTQSTGSCAPARAPADRPAAGAPHDTFPANNNRPEEMRTSCRQNRPLHRVMQQRCHHTSASDRSPSWPPMPRPRLQWAATARREKVQLRIREQSFSNRLSTFYRTNQSPFPIPDRIPENQCHTVRGNELYKILNLRFWENTVKISKILFSLQDVQFQNFSN